MLLSNRTNMKKAASMIAGFGLNMLSVLPAQAEDNKPTIGLETTVANGYEASGFIINQRPALQNFLYAAQ